MKTRVYDIPTRLFHWLFAFSFLAAFAISNLVDDDSLTFSFHMIAGLIMVFSVLLRLVWGIIGSQHAKFSDFTFNVSELTSYMKGILSDTGKKWSGHNPASSWAALTMIVLALGLGFTGVSMANGAGGDVLEEIHELLANAFLIVVILHVSGVVTHQFKHQDALGLSMISGAKQGLPEHTQAVSRHLRVGVLALFMVGGFSTYLVTHFDTSTRVLSVFGTSLQLSEGEDNQRESYHHEPYQHDELEDDDDDDD